MTRKKKRILVGLIAAAVVVPPVLCHFKQRDTYTCITCHSKRHVFQPDGGLDRESTTEPSDDLPDGHE